MMKAVLREGWKMKRPLYQKVAPSLRDSDAWQRHDCVCRHQMTAYHYLPGCGNPNAACREWSCMVWFCYSPSIFRRASLSNGGHLFQQLSWMGELISSRAERFLASMKASHILNMIHLRLVYLVPGGFTILGMW